MKENTSNSVLFIKKHNAYAFLKLAAFCFLLIMASCKAKKLVLVKRVAIDSAIKPVDTKAIKLKAIRAGQIDFETFSGKARTKLDISGSSNDVTLNIRIKKDKKIWISITAIAGIEAARVLITPDSIMVINRLQSLYLKKPFSYVNDFAGKAINYKTIESLLVGNAIPELINENADLQTSADSITLTGNLQQLVYKLKIGSGMKAQQTNLSNQELQQSLEVINGAFIQAGVRIVPSQIDITSLIKDKKIQVNLHYVKTDFDLPLEYLFSIPSRYKEGN